MSQVLAVAVGHGRGEVALDAEIDQRRLSGELRLHPFGIIAHLPFKYVLADRAVKGELDVVDKIPALPVSERAHPFMGTGELRHEAEVHLHGRLAPAGPVGCERIFRNAWVYCR
ncbi:MAG: hypothetical protein WA970_02570 [Gammaproteobacteria bacterium]